MNKPPLATLVLAPLGLASAYALAQGTLPKKARLEPAPPFTDGQWLNTKGGKPVTLASRKGKPTLVAFWTFACSNCQANIPAYGRLLAKYRPKGVEMISVHTPEMRIERDVEEVKRHVARYKIDYPVLIDDANANWDRWKVSAWPTLFVVDGDGVVVHQWVGELNWQGAGGEAKIGQILDGLLAKR